MYVLVCLKQIVSNIYIYICDCCLFLVNYKDKEETAQWVAAPATLKAILDGCLSRVSTLKGQALIVHHQSLYDAQFERVVLELQSELSDNCHVCLYAETENPTIFQYAVTQVKDKLLEVGVAHNYLKQNRCSLTKKVFVFLYVAQLTLSRTGRHQGG